MQAQHKQIEELLQAAADAFDRTLTVVFDFDVSWGDVEAAYAELRAAEDRLQAAFAAYEQAADAD